MPLNSTNDPRDPSSDGSERGSHSSVCLVASHFLLLRFSVDCVVQISTRRRLVLCFGRESPPAPRAFRSPPGFGRWVLVRCRPPFAAFPLRSLRVSCWVGDCRVAPGGVKNKSYLFAVYRCECGRISMPLFVTIFYTREATHDTRNEQNSALEKWRSWLCLWLARDVGFFTAPPKCAAGKFHRFLFGKTSSLWGA